MPHPLLTTAGPHSGVQRSFHASNAVPFWDRPPWLAKPIDFEALDDQPVDLVFLLLAPEGAGADHLKALARVARLLRDPDIARKLRDSRDAEALYAVLAMPSASAA